MEIKSKPGADNVLELTARVVIMGIILSVVMGAANVYLGLKAGLTVSASIPAAVVAMLVLKGLFRNGTILEANQVQTAASAGESLAAGIIFTMPALILIGVWKEFDFWTTTAIAFSGGLLGILFMIPMRKVFVVDDEELKYPEGVACAAVLEAGDEAGQAGSVIRGGLLGIAFAFAIKWVTVMQGAVATAGAVGGRILYFGGDISPALIAVGFIVRLNVAVLIFLGGAMGWLIGIPLLEASEAQLANPHAGAFELWSTQIRYVGVGAMVMGGIASIWHVRHGLVRAIKEMRKPVDPNDTQRDISGRVIGVFALIAVAIIGAIYYSMTKSAAITAVTVPIMIVMAFFFTAVASYIVGLVGNSNSPVSGMTITAVLFTGALLTVFGFTGTEGMVATLGVAAVVCCAACTSGDVCNDLKTGMIVGAKPYRQQIMQIIGVAAAALVMAWVLNLLHQNTEGGIGGRELSAPQAGLFAALAKGFFGDGKIPWDMVQWGVGLGVVFLLLDEVQKRREAGFRLHLMPIAVGMYLPFELATPILAGGLIAHFLSRGDTEAQAEERLRPGVLFSSGVIAGESLTGIGLAILASAQIPKLPQLLRENGLGDSGIMTFLGNETAIVTITLLATAGALYAFWRNGVARR